ncbi:uncharacterized protein LOC135389683 [Ornithodoros turicata]|uniref:uncharacterized protein LOC135389683 n=1 Tax=Ornithodoros turicata TaxID=34597 RepID=UPI00313860D7
MREYFTEGHAEPVTEPHPTNNLYYLPHHAVIRNEAVTTKVRIVLDASSHVPGQPSLNDVLAKGPNLNSDLLRFLITFRSSPIILTADIRKAYLQIHIRPQDRDALRFLWIQELPSASNPYPAVKQWRMTRVPFGASSSPFLLAATLHHHFRACTRYPLTAARLCTSFYVDDLVVGCDNTQEAETLYTETRAILQEAGMDIRKWAANSMTLQRKFLEDGTAYDNVGCMDTVLRVLGVPWDRHADALLAPVTAVHAFAKLNEPTKRTVLRTLSRLYDPFGLLAPFTVTAKLLFQAIWKDAVPWDRPMTNTAHQVWNKWVNGLPTLSLLNVPRCTAGTNGSVQDLQIFADASPRAYGAAIYMRVDRGTKGISCNLLLAKGRIAPLKPVTLPRLELLGCLLAARLYNRIRGVRPNVAWKATFWTDSQIALQWIKNTTSRCPQFVEGRVREIRHLTDPGHWRHCDGKNNPADLLTRGISADELVSSELWWVGPPWLSGSVDPPLEPISNRTPSSSRTEETCCPIAIHHGDPIIRLEDYSLLSRVLRVTAYVLRYVNNSRRPGSRLTGPISAQELHSAELLWVRRTQLECFGADVVDLQAARPISRSSALLTLNPYLDANSLLRVGGRLEFADEEDSTRHPVLLPAKHRLTELLVLDVHRRLHHTGVQDTLCELRLKYWIVKGRQTVRRVLQTCLQCRRRRLSSQTAPVAPLPRERVTPTSPFDVVGVDFAGPLYVHEDGKQRKAYIVLFTCGVTRAVHLELATGMSTQHFLSAFRRFTSRRGVPSLMMSDNARTFHQVSRLLSCEDVLNFAATYRIQWKFIVERAPWWGGWRERMVRSVKDALKRCLGRQRLTFEELTTALCEAECIVNCRPLTYVTSETEDLNPLTPADFLVGKHLTLLPTPGEVTPPPSAKGLRQYLKVQRRHRSQFWSRWRKEYLLQLRSAHMTRHKPESQLQVGDVVVIHDKGPPLMWKLGRVTQAFPGRDGVVRACAVALANRTVLHSPVQLLHRLEGDVERPAARGGC